MDQQEAKRRGLDELRDLRKEVEVQRAEMTVMRQALEAALGRWDTVQAPDYGQEFGRVCQSVGKLERRLAAVEQSDLVSNPYELVEQVRRMCSRGISDQAKTIEDTAQLANEAVKGMSGVVASARERQHQSNWVWGSFLAGFCFALFLTNFVLPHMNF